VSERLDQVMLSKGLVKTRSQARMLIKQGDVQVNGTQILKPGKLVNEADAIEISERGLYVSRGAYKLLKAIEEFKLDFSNKVVADCGASTGGFTQVSLMKGAKKVYALDVGHDQLDQTLKVHPRVENIEGVNLKHSYELSEKVDFCVVDLSFISLKLTYPTIHSFLKAGGQSVVLIKPQFEAGKQRLGKNGLVAQEDLKTILDEVLTWFKEQGHEVKEVCESPITGKTGNTEYLALIQS
tara:strand:+ start:952 stop:1668 length:717 start_codon:yes stop_codon:yes gene_type:complete